MTFSEYVKKYAMKQYLEYCQQKKVQPNFDLNVKAQPVCALLKSNKENSL
jgi:hypothetical protein